MTSKFDIAVNYVITENEGGYTDDPADHGGKTNFGITAEEATAHRCLIHPEGLVIKTIEDAKHVYQMDYWTYDAINDIRIATKVFDYAVNFGPKTAGILVQEALESLGYTLAIDGVIGFKTTQIINKVDPFKFLDALEAVTSDRYSDIVINDFIKTYGKVAFQKRQLKFLKGWIRRSNRRYYD